MKRKHNVWCWSIVVIGAGLLAWTLLGCNLPNRCAATTDGIAFGGPDAPIQTSTISVATYFDKYVEETTTVNCKHGVVTVLESYPPIYKCFLCGIELTYPNMEPIAKPKTTCDHFFVRQTFPVESEIHGDEYGLCVCIYCNEINVCK